MKLSVSLPLSLSTALFPPAKLGNNVRLYVHFLFFFLFFILNMYPLWGEEKA